MPCDSLQLRISFDSDHAHVSVSRLKGELITHLPLHADMVKIASLVHELAHVSVELFSWLMRESRNLLTPWVGRWKELPAIHIERLLSREIGLNVPEEHFSRDLEWIANGLFGLGIHSHKNLGSVCLRVVSNEIAGSIEAVLGHRLFRRETDPVLGPMALIRRNGNWQAHAVGILNGRARDSAAARALISAGPRDAALEMTSTATEYGGEP